MKITKEELLQIINLNLEIELKKLQAEVKDKELEIAALKRQNLINQLYWKYGLSESDRIDADGNVIRKEQDGHEESSGNVSNTIILESTADNRNSDKVVE